MKQELCWRNTNREILPGFSSDSREYWRVWHLSRFSRISHRVVMVSPSRILLLFLFFQILILFNGTQTRACGESWPRWPSTKVFDSHVIDGWQRCSNISLSLKFPFHSFCYFLLPFLSIFLKFLSLSLFVVVVVAVAVVVVRSVPPLHSNLHVDSNWRFSSFYWIILFPAPLCLSLSLSPWEDDLHFDGCNETSN